MEGYLIRGPFTYSVIDPDSHGHKHYRIADDEDNRVATCYVEGNAVRLVQLLNHGWAHLKPGEMEGVA